MRNVHIVGHTAGTASFREAATKDGTQVLNFSFAESQWVANQDGTTQSLEPNWFDGALYGADLIARYRDTLANTKNEIMLVGDYRQKKYVGSDGVSRTSNGFTVRQVFVAPPRLVGQPELVEEPAH